MTSTVVEFDVEMKCGGCEGEIKKALNDLGNGVSRVEVNSKIGSVLVQTTLPSSTISAAIEATGRRAVLKGIGSANIFKEEGVGSGKSSCGVAILGGDSGFSVGSVRGVVRLIGLGDKTIVEGTIDGLSQGKHGLHIHQYGDISQGCLSVGDHYNPLNNRHGGPGSIRHVGDLGNVVADERGRAEFRFEDDLLVVGEVIGRSIVVTQNEDDFGSSSHPMSSIDGNSGTRLACGIISRSAGLFENTKRICACDGRTLWQEHDIAQDTSKL